MKRIGGEPGGIDDGIGEIVTGEKIGYFYDSWM